MTDKTKVFNIDCLIGMKETPDKFYDIAIIDCPYGGGQHFNFRYGVGDQVYDSHKPDHSFWVELFRISNNQIVWGGNYFTSNLPENRCWLTWLKGNPLESFSDFELAWTSFDEVCKAIVLDSYGFNHADRRHTGNGTIHPTQKPVALYKWLLKNYAKEGDKIVDTHGGSMSSVIACLDMGFSITCYELDPDYYNAGKNRIINHLKQLNAFRPAYDIEFHDNSGVSQLRNNAGIGYQEQKDGANNNPIHRVDGLFHGDPSQSDIQTPKAS